MQSSSSSVAVDALDVVDVVDIAALINSLTSSVASAASSNTSHYSVDRALSLLHTAEPSSLFGALMAPILQSRTDFSRLNSYECIVCAQLMARFARTMQVNNYINLSLSLSDGCAYEILNLL